MSRTMSRRPCDAWIHDVSVYGYVDSWGASMRILNTGQVKYPAYCRRMRILALRSDICVDADVRGMQYPPAVLQRLRQRHDTYRSPAIVKLQCCQLTLILPHPLTFSCPPSLPLFVPSLLSLSLALRCTSRCIRTAQTTVTDHAQGGGCLTRGIVAKRLARILLWS